MSRKRILLVDDDPAVARRLGAAIERAGHYDVRTETNGALALAAALEFRPDVVLLDVLMPGIDGGEVAAALERHPDLEGVPIAFLTGLIEPGELGAGVTDMRGRRIISKPIDAFELVAVLRELCETTTDFSR